MDTEKTLVEEIQEFVATKGLHKRELYFYPDELPFAIPEGKVVHVVIEYASLAKHENRAES